jgi:hypothetical protein
VAAIGNLDTTSCSCGSFVLAAALPTRYLEFRQSRGPTRSPRGGCCYLLGTRDQGTSMLHQEVDTILLINKFLGAKSKVFKDRIWLDPRCLVLCRGPGANGRPKSWIKTCPGNRSKLEEARMNLLRFISARCWSPTEIKWRIGGFIPGKIEGGPRFW